MHAIQLLKDGSSLPAAEAAARRALALQPQDQLAYISLGALASAPEGIRLLQAATRLWPANAAVTHQLAGRIMSHGAEHRLAPALHDAASLFASLRPRLEHEQPYDQLRSMQPEWVGALPSVYNDALQDCDWADREAIFHALRMLAAAHGYALAGLSPLHMLYYPFPARAAGPAVLRAHTHIAQQLRAAATADAAAVDTTATAVAAAASTAGRLPGGRLHLAYTMADWREHITLRLLVAVLGLHDKTRLRVCPARGHLVGLGRRRPMRCASRHFCRPATRRRGCPLPSSRGSSDSSSLSEPSVGL